MNKDSQNPKDWFEIADDDLRFAKAGFSDTGIARDACLLSQQAVEKYLKGFLLNNNIKPEKTHVLLDLLQACSRVDKELLEIEEKCDFLDQFYNPVRYPGGVLLDFDRATAEKALKAAEEIIDFVKSKVIAVIK